MPAPDPALDRLAQLLGVDREFYDALGIKRRASDETVRQVIEALGVAIDGDAGPEQALARAQTARYARPMSEVQVHFAGEPALVRVRLYAGSHGPYSLTGRPQDAAVQRSSIGETWSTAGRLEQLVSEPFGEHHGSSYATYHVPLPSDLDRGYHALTLEVGGVTHETLLIAAPARAYEPAARGIGVFAPLYSLTDDTHPDGGDLATLGRAIDWVKKHDGNVVGTLPLLATYLDTPFDPSPYAPASRLFWNELVVDIGAVPELARAPAARALIESSDYRASMARAREARLVDYRERYRRTRPVLEALAEAAFTGEGPRRDALERALVERPRLLDYARFRALMEARGETFHGFPPALRNGPIPEAEIPERAFRYHFYVQWVLEEQLASLAGRARDGGFGLYLDLPLGVHSDSYDVFRERASFAEGVAAGAPADEFFRQGQNWGFPPFNPRSARLGGYRYLIESLRNHMRYAGVLRIDHVMWLHRMYWIPSGQPATDGVYVRSPVDELYAIVALESSLHRTLVVGEDLGTVPPEVRPAMARYGVQRIYVLQYEVRAHAAEALEPVPEASVAALNTHDMPPFAAFWSGSDVADRVDLGALTETEAEAERTDRAHKRRALTGFLRYHRGLEGEDAAAVRDAAHAELAASEAKVVLVNLEDLWLEEEPQNVPGTCEERPNWRRKARHSLTELEQEAVSAGRELERLSKLRPRRDA